MNTIILANLDAFRYARSPTAVFSMYNIAGMDGPSLVIDGYGIQWEIILVEGKIVNLQADGVQWFLRIQVPLTVHKYTFWKKNKVKDVRLAAPAICNFVLQGSCMAKL